MNKAATNDLLTLPKRRASARLTVYSCIVERYGKSPVCEIKGMWAWLSAHGRG